MFYHGASVGFQYVAGIEGKEVADTLAKEAAQDEEDRNYVYDRIPISTIASTAKEEGLKKWQAQWERAVKGAICRSFFPKRRAEAQITDRNNSTAHCYCQRSREDKAYLNRFKLTDNPMCPCNEGEQFY
jgi:hypothetical protein